MIRIFLKSEFVVNGRSMEFCTAPFRPLRVSNSFWIPNNKRHMKRWLISSEQDRMSQRKLKVKGECTYHKLVVGGKYENVILSSDLASKKIYIMLPFKIIVCIKMEDSVFIARRTIKPNRKYLRNDMIRHYVDIHSKVY